MVSSKEKLNKSLNYLCNKIYVSNTGENCSVGEDLSDFIKLAISFLVRYIFRVGLLSTSVFAKSLMRYKKTKNDQQRDFRPMLILIISSIQLDSIF